MKPQEIVSIFLPISLAQEMLTAVFLPGIASLYPHTIYHGLYKSRLVHNILILNDLLSDKPQISKSAGFFFLFV
jgi:hypothetical protein